MSVHLSPEEIEVQSFRIIDTEVGAHPWSPAEWPVVRRAIHTSADFEYARSLFFSRDAVAKAVEALRRGRGIVTDTTMALAGIGKERLARFGIGVSCFVADPEVAREAKAQGVTRSILAMRKGAADPANGIFVIGNAPTALFELLRLVREENLRPDLVVALPVGFVGAAESKEQLVLEGEGLGIPFITNRGRKGGSNVAAAVVNALLILAGEVL
jgi:precorrin-8X/cobalt-precorrin-8 methylmutase